MKVESNFMRLGFGSTVWLNGLKNNKLDGIGVYTKELWKTFETMNIELYPLSFSKRLPTGSFTSQQPVTYSLLKFPIHLGLHTLLKSPIDELQSYRQNIDLFFAPDHHIPIIKDKPVVATVMDIIPFVHPEWVSSRFRRLKNFMFKRSILSADHIITISEYSKNDIINYLNICPDKISVVDLGVNKDFFNKVPKNEKQKILDKFNLEKDFFLFIGTLQPRKNVLRIIQAHRALPDKIKKDHPLIIVGQYGWDSQDLMHEIQVMQKNQDGVWLSYVKQAELFSLLQSAISLVYPSLYEGFGLPIIEGFASGCPVITSNVTSLPEVAGDAALQVDPTSIEEINIAMYRIIKEEGLRDQLIQKANNRVKKYDWNDVAKAHINIFNKVLTQYE